MKHRKPRFCFGLSLVMLLWLSCGNTFAQAIERPEVHVGDQWKYRVTDSIGKKELFQYTSQIVDLNDKEIVTQVTWSHAPNRKGTHLYNRAWNLIDNERGRLDPFLPQFKFPLRAGASWTQSYQDIDIRTGAVTHCVAIVKMDAMESVTVPAGTFTAMKIIADLGIQKSSADGTSFQDTVTIWYSKEANRLVKSEHQRFTDGKLSTRTTQELVQYVQEK